MTAFVLRTVMQPGSLGNLILWAANQCLVFDFVAFTIVAVSLATTSSSGHIP